MKIQASGVLRRDPRATLARAGRDVIRTLTDWHDHARDRFLAGVSSTGEAGTAVEERARREEIQLVQRVFFPAGLGARRTVLFAGVEGENGCAAVCVRAGQTLARLTPQAVCVVDANVRSPVLHRLVGGGGNHEGFATAVGRPGTAPTFATQWAGENIWVLPSGSSTASDADGLLDANRARACIEELMVQFRNVVLCAPPIDLYAESLALGQLVEGVVLVVEANVTRREIVRTTKDRLEDLGVPLLGIVLNDRTFPIPNALRRLL